MLCHRPPVTLGKSLRPCHTLVACATLRSVPGCLTHCMGRVRHQLQKLWSLRDWLAAQQWFCECQWYLNARRRCPREAFRPLSLFVNLARRLCASVPHLCNGSSSPALSHRGVARIDILMIVKCSWQQPGCGLPCLVVRAGVGSQESDPRVKAKARGHVSEPKSGIRAEDWDQVTWHKEGLGARLGWVWNKVANKQAHELSQL